MKFLKKIYDSVFKQSDEDFNEKKGFNLERYKKANEEQDINVPTAEPEQVQQPQQPVQPPQPVQQPQRPQPQSFTAYPKGEKTVEQKAKEGYNFSKEMINYIQNNITKEKLDVQPDPRWFYNYKQKEFFQELVVEFVNDKMQVSEEVGDNILNNFLRQIDILGAKKEEEGKEEEKVSLEENDLYSIFSESSLGINTIKDIAKYYKNDFNLVNEAAIYRLADPSVTKNLRGVGIRKDQRLNFLANNPDLLPESLIQSKPEDVDLFNFLQQENIKSFVLDYFADLLKNNNNELYSKLKRQINQDAGFISKQRMQEATERGEVSLDVPDDEGKSRAGNIGEEEKAKDGEFSEDELDIQREKFTSIISEEINSGLVPNVYDLCNKISDNIKKSGKEKDINLADQLDLYSGLMKKNVRATLKKDNFIGYNKKGDSVIYKSPTKETKKGKGIRYPSVSIPFNAFMTDSPSGGEDVDKVDDPSDRIKKWEPRLDRTVPNSQLAFFNGQMAMLKTKIKDSFHERYPGKYRKIEEKKLWDKKLKQPVIDEETGEQKSETIKIEQDIPDNIKRQYSENLGSEHQSDIVDFLKKIGKDGTPEEVENFIYLTLSQSYDYLNDKKIAVQGVGWKIDNEGNKVPLKWTDSNGKKRSFRSPRAMKTYYRESNRFLEESLNFFQDPRVLKTFSKFMNYLGLEKPPEGKKQEARKTLKGPLSGGKVYKDNDGRKKPMSFVLFERMGDPIPQKVIDEAVRNNKKIDKNEIKQMAKEYNEQFGILANIRSNMIFTKYCQVVDKLDQLYKYKKHCKNLKLASTDIKNVDILIEKEKNDFKLFLERIS